MWCGISRFEKRGSHSIVSLAWFAKSRLTGNLSLPDFGSRHLQL